MKRFIALGIGLLSVATASADILYTRNTETGNRANGGGAGFTVGAPADPNRALFDDIPIPVTRLASGGGNATSVDVTRITVGIRRVGSVATPAPATDVSVFYSTISTTAVAPDTNLDTPPTLVGTSSLLQTTTAVTELVTFGDGTSTLFNVPMNYDFFTPPGTFGAFSVGVRISDATSGLNGWRITSGPDANAQALFWLYDPGHTAIPNDEGAFQFGGTVPSSFYVIVEGTPVPEPASLGLLALGALTMLRRR